MTLHLRLHTLGDLRDAIAPSADYPDAGTGSTRAKSYIGLGLFGAIGAAANEYRAEAHSGLLSADGRKRLQDAMSHVLWYATRAIVEHDTHNAGLLWGHLIGDIQAPAHVDTPANAWLYMPQLLARTDFAELHDTQYFLRNLAIAAGRHRWTLEDLGRHWAVTRAENLQAVGA